MLDDPNKASAEITMLVEELRREVETPIVRIVFNFMKLKATGEWSGGESKDPLAALADSQMEKLMQRASSPEDLRILIDKMRDNYERRYPAPF